MIQFAPDGPEEIGAPDARDQVIRLALQCDCYYSRGLSGFKELCAVVKWKEDGVEDRKGLRTSFFTTFPACCERTRICSCALVD